MTLPSIAADLLNAADWYEGAAACSPDETLRSILVTLAGAYRQIAAERVALAHAEAGGATPSGEALAGAR